MAKIKSKPKKKVSATTKNQRSSAPSKISIHRPLRKEKPIGKVTHFYGNISVAIVKFNRAVKVGQKIRFEGETTNFSQDIKSMQFNHKEIKTAPKGRQVGIKVKDKVRDGDAVYAEKF